MKLSTLLLTDGKKEKNLFTNYKMIYPFLNHSMRWKSDYIFFGKIEKSKQKHGSRKRLTSRGNV